MHYNIGHIAAAHGDTVKPHGHWVVGMNKWAIDRFADVGPLLPQNFQLVDVSGPAMQLVYDAADPARRAALHPDHRGRPHQGDRPLHAGRHRSADLRSWTRARPRAARSASSATATRCTST